MSTPQAKTADSADELRDELVSKLLERDAIKSSGVEAAFRAVPRHLFLPEVPLAEAYVNDAVVTVRNEHDTAVSSVSAPWIQAMMLEQSGLGPGMRALEIGSGGCNAALIAELVGEQGEVISVDIDPEVSSRAQKLLAETGYDRVRVLCADGTYGAGEDAPTGGFDAIIVTAQAGDIPQAWTAQLAANGRLVVPLTFRGMHRAVCFEREGRHLRSRELTICGFVGMRGDSTSFGRSIHLSGDDLRLTVDEDQHVDEDALRAALSSSPQETIWTGAILRENEGVLASLDAWLVSATAPSGRVYASRQGMERGLSGWMMGAAATWANGSIAYTTVRPQTSADGTDALELGVHAYGPERGVLAERLAEQIRLWDAGHRSRRQPVLRAYPAATDSDELAPGHVIDKRRTRLVLAMD